MFRTCFIAALAYLTFSQIALPSIMIDLFSAQANDRFENDPAFVLNGANLSGVALTSNGRWVTMLSSNVFVTADHYAPTIGSSVKFYGSNNPLGSTFNSNVLTTQKLGSTDIRLGVLDSALPSSYAYYDILNYPIPPNSNVINVFPFGRSPSPLPTTQDMAVGINVMDIFSSNMTVVNQDNTSSTGDAGITTYNNPGDPLYVSYETQLAIGDSGGPVMAVSGNQLTIVGVNWAIGTSGSGQPVSIFSFLPNYQTEIDAYILENALTPIPETATAAFILNIAALILIQRRRR